MSEEVINNEMATAEPETISITMNAKTWKDLLKVFSQADELALLQRGDGVEFRSIDRSHVYMVLAKFSILCEGDGSEGLLFVKEMESVLKPLTNNTIVRYTYSRLDEKNCEISISYRGGLEGTRTFKREYIPLNIVQPPKMEATAETVISVRMLQQLFKNFPEGYGILVSIERDRFCLRTEVDGDACEVSVYVDATGSDKSSYSLYHLDRLVKSLPSTALTARIGLYKAYQSSLDGRLLNIIAYLQNGEIGFIIALRIV